ncbi:MerR family transcriptional regulator [Gorillibacterium sp. sgz5001074]|uniref:MerR family transcriptional regulator n=1 Tax=Gorillibacterium sp. sgz5001074 TaxID=3446695 RepID=UPI003F67F67E
MAYLKVGELARLTGLTIRTLRYYDQMGLLHPSAQTEAGHRLYEEADLARLHQILTLKELGLSLEEIKALLLSGQVTPEETVRLQMERLEQEIWQRSRLLELLRHVSKSMQRKAPIPLEDFTGLLQAMKAGHEKLVIGRRTDWMHSLERLEAVLSEEESNNPMKEELE